MENLKSHKLQTCGRRGLVFVEFFKDLRRKEREVKFSHI